MYLFREYLEITFHNLMEMLSKYIFVSWMLPSTVDYHLIDNHHSASFFLHTVLLSFHLFFLFLADTV